jgi:myo-inositol-1(or 4)-monophosphatase
MSEFLTVCEQAARAAGQVLLDWQGKFAVHEKGPSDLVTDADFAAQECITDVILGKFPDHVLLGEESDLAAQQASRAANDGYRWIVDPLDGTNNYVHSLPCFAVSIALEHQGQLLCGTIYDPVADECFTAAQGLGAKLNGKTIHASAV